MYKNGKLKKRTTQNVSELSQVDVLIYKIRQQSDLHCRCRRHNGQSLAQEKKTPDGCFVRAKVMKLLWKIY